MSAELKASRRDATLILTISNPGTMNAFHPDMAAAAVETLSTAERDDSLRAVVLTGADNCFSAGGDLRRLLEARSRDKGELADSIDALHGWIEAIRACPKPVIAAVEGAAANAGFALALACDMIVAGASARFVMGHARVGLTPDGGASWFLAQALPRQLAAEILIGARPLPAQRLYDLGLINRLVVDGSALLEALALADELAELSPNAVERIKSLLSDAQENALPRQLETEKQQMIESLLHRDAPEGIRAFLEKRKPQFK